MDCSKTVDFIKEKERMCKTLDCDVCPIGSHLNKYNCICDCFVQNHIEKAVKIVQRWSDEHQREIDWTKVPVDTPVLVWDSSEISKTERHFAIYMPASNYPYRVFDFGDDLARAKVITAYENCELAPEIDPTPYYKE